MENGSNSRLRQLLESYGADRRRWPDAERGIDAAAPEEAAAAARDIDAILSLASAPPAVTVPVAGLLARIGEPASARVVTFPRQRPSRSIFRLAAALPLAASLAFGAYLGASGTLDFMLPSAVTGGVALNDDTSDDLGGVDDVVAFAQDGLT